MTPRPFLAALADRLGMEPAYTDLEGVRHVCSDAASVTLLAAMGVAAATETESQAALEQLDREEEAQMLPPVCVLPAVDFARSGVVILVPTELRGHLTWRAEINTEQGEKLIREGTAVPTDMPTLRIEWPDEVPIGYHDVTVSLSCAGRERRAIARLTLTPTTCVPIESVLKGRRAFGLCANLYTLHSAANWGVGDFADLQVLIRWMGRAGGAFVGTNPLHSLHNRDPDISPYSPVSRLFRSPIYLDVTAVPEWAEYAAALSTADLGAQAEKIATLRASDEVDYHGVWTFKQEILRALHAIFTKRRAKGDTERGRQFRAYVAAQGSSLDDYATFMALVDQQTAQTGDGRDFRRWPAELRDARSSAVAAFCRDQAAAIDFYRFLQFEMDRQLALAAGECRSGRLAIGLYPDLAIGSAPHGADVWARPDLFVSEARLGCPPDYYAPQGQEWGLPPLNPHRLRAEGYDYWIRMLRANLAHGGALRIDHVIGLKRQFWIPAGGAPKDGAYVRQPVGDLLGILALESVRHGAVIIGEDLGTVPEGFSSLLRRWGVLSCQVMYFQREVGGAFLPAADYSDRALVTSTTHDHVALGGFTEGADLKIRRRVGVIASDAQLHTMLGARRRDVDWLHQRLVAENAITPQPDTSFNADGTLPPRNGHDPAVLCGGVHRFLSKTAAPLVGIMLDDVAGESQPVNVPGVGPDKLRCWSRRMTMPLESIPDAPASRAALDALSSRKS